jgi:hypothetical protein
MQVALAEGAMLGLRGEDVDAGTGVLNGGGIGNIEEA